MNRYNQHSNGSLSYQLQYYNNLNQRSIDKRNNEITQNNSSVSAYNLKKMNDPSSKVSQIGNSLLLPIASSTLGKLGKKYFNRFRQNLKNNKESKTEGDGEEGEGEGEGGEFEGGEGEGEGGEFEGVEGDFEIGPTPMTDLELQQFADPSSTGTVADAPSNLDFEPAQTENMEDEEDLGELDDNFQESEEGLSFIQKGLGRATMGAPKINSAFTPEGTKGAGADEDFPQGENDDFDVGKKLNPDTLEPLDSGENVVEQTPEDIEEGTSDFQSVLDMANARPEAEIVSGQLNTGEEFTGDVEYGDPSPYTNLPNFGQTAEQMAGTQFGGDSTIARMNQTPKDLYSEHQDNLNSQLAETKEDDGNTSEFGDIDGEPTEAPTEVDPEISNLSSVGDTTAEVGEAGEIATEAGIDATGASIEAGVVSGEVALGAVEASTLPVDAVPVVDIASAVVGAGALVGSIGLGVYGAVESLIHKAPAPAPITNPALPQEIAGKYLGLQSDSYRSNNQNFQGIF